MSVQYMSFSAHADAKGIMQLISYCEPRHIMLVHGEAAKMDFLKGKIQKEFGKWGRMQNKSSRFWALSRFDLGKSEFKMADPPADLL